jgi:AraC family transcriptional regulator
MPISSDSLSCVSPQRNRIIASSRDHGWRSLLLDHLEGVGEAAPYDKLVTPDLCLTVGVGGAFETSVLRLGRWRTGLYRPGSVGITVGGEGHRLRWRTMRATQTFRTISLYLPAPLIEEAKDHLRRPGERISLQGVPAQPFSDRMVTQIALDLLRAMHAGAGDLYADCAARWLVTHLVEAWRGDPSLIDHACESAALSDSRLARVIEFARANLDRALSINLMASEAGISPFHFTRVFRRATGQTVNAFLTDQRMRAARRLLLNTDLSIAEVAQSCGYSRATAFATAFARHSGCTPSRYRSSNGMAPDLRDLAQ